MRIFLVISLLIFGTLNFFLAQNAQNLASDMFGLHGGLGAVPAATLAAHQMAPRLFVIAASGFVLGLLGCWRKLHTNILVCGTVLLMLLDLVCIIVFLWGLDLFCTKFIKLWISP
jgi:hypothetical protein